MNIGEQIKKVRIEKKLSQYELAKKTGRLTQSQISKIENGERKITALDLLDLSEALEVPVDALIK